MPTYEELLQENVELRRRIAEQERRIAQLEKIIEDLRRDNKRQAAPFSKGKPKSEPEPPGRKPAERYGKRAFRPVPEKVDEKIDVGCPLYCDTCQGRVRLAGKTSQYQIDLPEIRTWTTEFVLQEL